MVCSSQQTPINIIRAICFSPEGSRPIWSQSTFFKILHSWEMQLVKWQEKLPYLGSKAIRRMGKFTGRVGSHCRPWVMRHWCTCSPHRRLRSGPYSCFRTSTITTTQTRQAYSLQCQYLNWTTATYSNAQQFLLLIQSLVVEGVSLTPRWLSNRARTIVAAWRTKWDVRTRPMWIRSATSYRVEAPKTPLSLEKIQMVIWFRDCRSSLSSTTNLNRDRWWQILSPKTTMWWGFQQEDPELSNRVCLPQIISDSILRLSPS